MIAADAPVPEPKDDSAFEKFANVLTALAEHMPPQFIAIRLERTGRNIFHSLGMGEKSRLAVEFYRWMCGAHANSPFFKDWYYKDHPHRIGGPSPWTPQTVRAVRGRRGQGPTWSSEGPLEWNRRGQLVPMTPHDWPWPSPPRFQWGEGGNYGMESNLAGG